MVKDSFGCEWSLLDGKERSISFNWPEELKQALHEELNSKIKREEKVYFVTGNKYNKAVQRMDLIDRTEECNQEIAIIDSKYGQQIASYMNNLPINTFTKILENADQAHDKIVTSSMTEEAKMQQLKILQAVLESPKPLYKPSKNGNTDRLFGYGANITNLKKEVRRELTNGS